MRSGSVQNPGPEPTCTCAAPAADTVQGDSSRASSPHPVHIRLTAGFFTDPFADLDGYLRSAKQYAALGFDLLNSGPLPGNPDPVGWVKRLGDEVIPRLPS